MEKTTFFYKTIESLLGNTANDRGLSKRLVPKIVELFSIITLSFSVYGSI